MKPTVKHIPILIATILVAFSIASTFLSNMKASNFQFVYSNAVLLMAGGLAITWLSMFIKSNLWVYLLLFLFIASFSEYVAYGTFEINFSIGAITIDLIALPLVISHVLINADSFKLSKTQKEDEDDFEHKIAFFIKQHENKSMDELEKLVDSDLLPEAKEAVQRIIQRK